MKKILAALTVPGLVIAGAAVAGAQADDEGTTTDDTSVEAKGCNKHRGGRGHQQFADALGITVEELRDAVQGGQTVAEVADGLGVDIDSVIAGLVAEAQAQADENPDSPRAQNFDAEAFTERLTSVVDGTFEPGDHPGRRGGRNRGPGGGNAIAEALGLDQVDVRAALESGSTIADLATEQGVDLDAVIDQIVADAQARADEQPDSPRAQNFDAAQLEERLTEKVNSTFEPGERRGRGFGPQGRPGPGGGSVTSGADA